MEQKSSGENNLSWREAIIEVLKKSSKPMSSVEIVAAIKERKLRNVTGNTPEATVGAQIYTSMKRDGEGSSFVQPAPNQFAYKQPNKFLPGNRSKRTAVTFPKTMKTSRKRTLE